MKNKKKLDLILANQMVLNEKLDALLEQSNIQVASFTVNPTIPPPPPPPPPEGD